MRPSAAQVRGPRHAPVRAPWWVRGCSVLARRGLGRRVIAADAPTRAARGAPSGRSSCTALDHQRDRRRDGNNGETSHPAAHPTCLGPAAPSRRARPPDCGSAETTSGTGARSPRAEPEHGDSTSRSGTHAGQQRSARPSLDSHPSTASPKPTSPSPTTTTGTGSPSPTATGTGSPSPTATGTGSASQQRRGPGPQAHRQPGLSSSGGPVSGSGTDGEDDDADGGDGTGGNGSGGDDNGSGGSGGTGGEAEDTTTAVAAGNGAPSEGVGRVWLLFIAALGSAGRSPGIC